MTLRELIEQARIRLDDSTEDYLWSDAELTYYFNEAEKEACRRTRLIIDASTSSVCQIDVTANNADYDLHPKIIKVLDIVPSWDSVPLGRITTQELNLNEPSWRTRTSGKPDRNVTDFQSNAIRLFPKPTEDGTLNLRVQRLPLKRMSSLEDSPEIKEMYHDKLIHWVCHMAYLKPDADTFNKNASMEALAIFESEFGQARSAWAVEFDNQHMPNDIYSGA